jgi:hypothetical protein
MRTVLTGTAVVLGLLLAAPAWAQVKKSALGDGPKVHPIEIWNGPIRTVHYVYQDLSPSEESVLKELERAQNEAFIADMMTKARQAYLTTELVMEPRRRQVQYLLYGYNSDTTAGLLTGAGIGGYGFGAGGALGYAAPYGVYPYAFNGAYGGLGYGGGYGGGYGLGFTGGSSTNTLAVGIGDEGVLKTEAARTMAAQMTPEKIAAAYRDLDNAMAMASTIKPIRVALGLPEDKGGEKHAGFLPPFYKEGTKLSVTRMLDGKSDKIDGTVLGDNDQWLLLDTMAGKRRILKTTVVDVLELK